LRRIGEEKMADHVDRADRADLPGHADLADRADDAGRGQTDGDSERGALSLMFVALFVAIMLLVGFVIDGGVQLAAEQRATALAQEAARAAATTVDVPTAYASGSFVIDQGEALTAAREYLIASGDSDPDVSVITSAHAIQVTVTIKVPTEFLSMIGLSSFTCTRTATASLVTGITGGT
jgi:Flp pilus assembly protein TadG